MTRDLPYSADGATRADIFRDTPDNSRSKQRNVMKKTFVGAVVMVAATAGLSASLSGCGADRRRPGEPGQPRHLRPCQP
jgi:hypothetical protein